MSIVPAGEPRIWLTSDWHFNHDREFIWKVRGFASVGDMNEHIIAAHNTVVNPDDDVYVLGDLMLGDSEKGIECIKRMNGKLHIVWGNHDTDNRKAKYAELPNVVESNYAIVLKHKKHHFYMSHYPTITSNNDYDKPLMQRTLNLCGHTHTFNPWEDIDKGYIYHCEMEAHNCKPVLLDDILQAFYSL